MVNYVWMTKVWGINWLEINLKKPLLVIALFRSVCFCDRHHSPVTHNDDDHQGNEEDQPRCSRANDEREFLLNARIVFLCKGGDGKNKASQTRRVTVWHKRGGIWAAAYGRSSGWHPDIRLGGPTSILASSPAEQTFLQTTANVLGCCRHWQIIWQKVCKVGRENMFGWHPDLSGSQEWEIGYQMITHTRRRTSPLHATDDFLLFQITDRPFREVLISIGPAVCGVIYFRHSKQYMKEDKHS